MAFELLKPHQNLCSSHIVICRSYCNILRVSVAFFSQFEAKFDADTLFCQISPLLITNGATVEPRSIVFQGTGENKR